MEPAFEMLARERMCNVGLRDTCWFPTVLMIVHRQKMLRRVNVRQIQKVKQETEVLSESGDIAV